VVRTLALAGAVALLGAMLLFVGHSLRTMTRSAVRSVPLDWQGPVGSAAAASRIAAGTARKPGMLAAAPVATASFAGIEHRSAAGKIRSGAGSILAVAPAYSAARSVPERSSSTSSSPPPFRSNPATPCS
jgi:hypothetical protein